MEKRYTHKLLVIFLATTMCLIYFKFPKTQTASPEYIATTTPNPPNNEIKKKFEQIYDTRFWGKNNAGDGSGPGSTIRYTVNCRNIIYSIIKKYNITSFLDSPCGSFIWMQHLMKNVSSEITDFKYHGIDIVGPVIGNLTSRFADRYPKWEFSLVDFTEQPLPTGYELIFSRDATQHLPVLKTIQFLENIARTKTIKYFLSQSFIESKRNRNINVGEYFAINFLIQPFDLVNYIEVYREGDHKKKHLILFDVDNYIRKINFTAMRERAKHLLRKKIF